MLHLTACQLARFSERPLFQIALNVVPTCRRVIRRQVQRMSALASFMQPQQAFATSRFTRSQHLLSRAI